MMKEIWKDVKGYEGLYEVSNAKKVRSVERTVICNHLGGRRKAGGNIIKSKVTKSGNERVQLLKGSKIENKYVEILVAEAFDLETKKIVIIKKRIQSHVRNSKKIEQYSKTGELIKVHDSISSACESIKKDISGRSAISRCCNNFRKSAYGYVWKYAK